MCFELDRWASVKERGGHNPLQPVFRFIHAHYQSSIYDIDGDGNLELLCADGTFGSYGTQVWDLWSWKLDANITAGYSFRGPSIGEVTGDGQMDIIVVTFDPSTY